MSNDSQRSSFVKSWPKGGESHESCHAKGSVYGAENGKKITTSEFFFKVLRGGNVGEADERVVRFIHTCTESSALVGLSHGFWKKIGV